MAGPLPPGSMLEKGGSSKHVSSFLDGTSLRGDPPSRALHPHPGRAARRVMAHHRARGIYGLRRSGTRSTGRASNPLEHSGGAGQGTATRRCSLRRPGDSRGGSPAPHAGDTDGSPGLLLPLSPHSAPFLEANKEKPGEPIEVRGCPTHLPLRLSGFLRFRLEPGSLAFRRPVPGSHGRTSPPETRRDHHRAQESRRGITSRPSPGVVMLDSGLSFFYLPAPAGIRQQR
jgi:hypothetical protein